jgi:hypothetical protein
VRVKANGEVAPVGGPASAARHEATTPMATSKVTAMPIQTIMDEVLMPENRSIKSVKARVKSVRKKNTYIDLNIVNYIVMN